MTHPQVSAQDVGVDGEAEEVLEEEDVVVDRNMRLEIVDEFVSSKVELNIRVEIDQLLQIIFINCVSKVELSCQSCHLYITFSKVRSDKLFQCF